MTTVKTITVEAALYMAYITAEILQATKYTTADLVEVPADHVAEQFAMPLALKLEKLENALFVKFPSMWRWGWGVYTYEVVEALGQKFGQFLMEHKTIPTEAQQNQMLAEAFCSDGYWDKEDTPQAFFIEARITAATL